MCFKIIKGYKSATSWVIAKEYGVHYLPLDIYSPIKLKPDGSDKNYLILKVRKATYFALNVLTATAFVLHH